MKGLWGFRNSVHVVPFARWSKFKAFVKYNQDRKNFRERNPEQIRPYPLTVDAWDTFRIKNVQSEVGADAYERIQIQLPTRNHMLRHTPCSMLKLRFPGVDKNQTMKENDAVTCFPISDPYRPGIFDVLLHWDQKNKIKNHVNAGYPVQVKGSWSWDIFPQIDLENQKITKDHMKTSEERELNLPSLENIENRICLMCDTTGVAATLQILNELLGSQSSKQVTVICYYIHDTNMPLKGELDRIATVAKNIKVHYVLFKQPKAKHRAKLEDELAEHEALANVKSEKDYEKFKKRKQDGEFLVNNSWSDIAHVVDDESSWLDVMKKLVPEPFDEKHGPCRLIGAMYLDYCTNEEEDLASGTLTEHNYVDDLFKLGYPEKQLTILSFGDF